MSFTRTISGLKNSYLFFKVDAVVYLEGGKTSYSREDVDNGRHSDSSADIRFWQAIFNLYLATKKFKFCSIGSKKTALSIANEICSNQLSKVIVVMDSDHDGIYNTKISNTNVLYSYGYSWENDLWNEYTLFEASINISGICRTVAIKNILPLVQKYLRYFYTSLNKFINLDIVLRNYSSSFFNRDSYHKYFNHKTLNFNFNELLTTLKVKKASIHQKVVSSVGYSYSKHYNCFGHMLGDYFYFILVKIIKSNLSKDIAISSLVPYFINTLQNNTIPILKSHYDSEFARIII